MEEKKFDLTPILEKGTGIYKVKDFDNQISLVKDYISKNCLQNVEITDEQTFKEVKNKRTEIRKKLETISTARKDVTDLIIGTFSSQLKEIEKMLDAADKVLKSKVDSFQVATTNKVEKPKFITLTVKGLDSKKIDKVKEYALKQGLEVAVK